MRELRYKFNAEAKCQVCKSGIKPSAFELCLFGDRNLLSVRSKVKCENCGYTNTVGGLVREGDDGYLTYRKINIDKAR